MLGATVRRPPIRWGNKELDAIATRWIRYCNEQGQDPVSPTMPMSKIMDDAQMAIPAHLHRPRPSLQGIKNLKPILDAVKAKVKQMEAEEQERLALIAQEELQAAQAMAEAAKLAEQQEQERAANEQKLEDVIDDFASNIASMIASRTMRAIRAEFKNEFPKLHMRAMAASKILPKVLVIGPLGKQQEDLERAVDGLVDLKFVSSEEGPRLVQLRGSSCQECVLWTAFMNHAHQEAAQRVFGRDGITFVQGRGLSSVKATLEEVALRITSDS